MSLRSLRAPLTLAASVACHGALGVLLLASRLQSPAPQADPGPSPVVGDAFDVERESAELGGRVGREPSDPPGREPDDRGPSSGEPAPPSAPKDDRAPREPAPRPAPTAASPSISVAPRPPPSSPPAPSVPPSPSSARPAGTATSPSPIASGSAKPAAPAAGSASAPSAGAPHVARFGAAGDPSAVDVRISFARMFRQFASTIPEQWATSGLGSEPPVDVIVTIQESGAFVAYEIVGTPSPPFREGIRRAMAWMQPRALVGAAARTRLRLTCTVSESAAPFLLESSPDGRHAAFHLTNGRRVDLDVRVVP